MFLAAALAISVGLLAEQLDYQHGPDPTRAVEWAETRFAAAGLDLPAHAFIVADDCGPRQRATWNGSTIKLCATDEGIWWTLLHELGHAYSDTLTDEQRTQIAAGWGAAEWYDLEAEHDARAGEQFADMLAWALHPIRDDSQVTLTPEQMFPVLEQLGITPLWGH